MLADMTRAIRCTGPGELELIERATPAPEQGEVLVRIEAAALCSTDLELVAGTLDTARLPVVPGHETAGRIERVGRDVSPERIGERVAIQGVVGCGICPPCVAGRTEFCRTAYDEIGFTRDGGWAEALTVPAANAVAVPETWSPELVALLEPFACCFGAVADEPIAGQRVAVIGSGPAALYFVLALRGLGAAHIAVYLKRPDNEALARTMGASAVHLDAREDQGYDMVVDAVGSEGSLREAIETCLPGGRVILYGLRDETARIPVRDVAIRTITIGGRSARPDIWPRAIAAIEVADASPTAIISRRVSMWEIPEVVASQLAGTRDRKIVATPD